MFTGIIESVGKIVSIEKQATNLILGIQSAFLDKLKIDQSIAHNGVCLTVDGIFENFYTVTIIAETLSRTNLGELKEGDIINLERCLKSDGRFDGHIVQGHVDQIGTCIKAIDNNGSWDFHFEYDASRGNVTIEKGSICINGVSLTVVESTATIFSISLIPYTYEHTNFKNIQVGSIVNLEFDIIGKYVKRLLSS